MVYINLRHTVTDYDKWLAAFESNGAFRQAGGATGKNQIFRDVNDTNTVSMIMEWDTEEHAKKFLANPEFTVNMESAGVVTPAVSTLQSRVIRAKS